MMKLTFTVIDDSELDCFILKRIIQHIDADFTVATYYSAWEAWNSIELTKEDDPNFTLIFLDLTMPIMNGFQFMDAFERLPQAIKEKYRVVILSTTRNPSDIARLMSYDIVDSIVEKPITKEKFHTILSSLRTEV